MNILEKEYNEKDAAYFAHERNEMLKYIPKHVKCVLDVGCSSGSFGSAVKREFNCEVWGIEPDKRASEKAELVLDKVYNTIFSPEINLNNQKFDCIFFNDVLEHLINPFEALELCKSHLSQGGFVIASVPNIRFFDAIYHILVHKDFHYVNAGIFDKTHLRFFTKKSAGRMFLEANYKVKEIEGINSIKELNYKGYKNFRILNKILFNNISDMEYLQFAIVAHL